jgi:hypothetical protein
MEVAGVAAAAVAVAAGGPSWDIAQVRLLAEGAWLQSLHSALGCAWHTMKVTDHEDRQAGDNFG